MTLILHVIYKIVVLLVPVYTNSMELLSTGLVVNNVQLQNIAMAPKFEHYIPEFAEHFVYVIYYLLLVFPKISRPSPTNTIKLQ